MRQRRTWGLMAGVIVLVGAATVPAWGAARQDISSNNGVVQTFQVSYNGGTCNGTSRYQITGISSTFTRSSTSRRVSVVHFALASKGRKCDGEVSLNERTGQTNPTWGCGGRCSNLESEGGGYSVSWPYIMGSGATEAGFIIAGSGHAHVTDGNGNQLGTICGTANFLNGPIGCQ